jgi:DNA polymerase
MDKAAALQQIAADVEACGACREGKSGTAVPGEGNPDAAIVFIGEAPGRQEARTGRPFVGRSGQLLRAHLRAIGLRDEDVFITSVVKYVPDSGTPRTADIAHGATRLRQQLAIIGPKVVILLGRVAAQGVLGENVSLASKHGDALDRGGRTHFFMYHPAAALRSPAVKPDFVADL